MADDDDQAVKLHGVWASPFSCRVKWVLELKGIPYEYVEEDLANKSQMLRDYNPVYQKIPVLVHGGKPVCESMIIVEYLDQIWPHKTPLLPNDPCERASARFWVKFIEDKGLSIWIMFRTTGEEQEKAKQDSLEMLRTIEEHAFTGDKTGLFGGDKVGIVDIAFGVIAIWLGVLEEVLGFRVFEANEFPKLHAWANTFKQVPLIKQALPPHDALFLAYKRYKESLLGLS